MTAGYVPTSPLNDLYANTTAQTPADPAAVDAAIQAIVQTVNDNYDNTTGLVSTGTLSRLGVINVKDYNASGSANTYTGSITINTKVLTFTTAHDFAQGQGINLPGVYEVASLQVTAAATGSSNVTVTLNGVAHTVAVVNGDTAIQVATKIRAATYAGWTAGGTAGTDTVTFTSTTTGTKTDATYSAGTTGATGTMTTTTQGVADQISTVSSVSGLVVNIADNATRTITAGTFEHSDTVAIQAAVTYAISIGKTEIIMPYGTYRYGTLTGTSGITFIGDGVTLVGTTTLTLVSISALQADIAPEYNRGGLIFGQEYLSSFHKKIMAWSSAGTTLFKAVFSGDSTIAGDSTSGTSFHIDQLIKDTALKNGFPMLSVVNNGQSGKDTEHWNQTYYNTDLTATPDILILRWGINDPYYKHSDNSILPDQSTVDPTVDALRRTASDFETSLRSGLTKIRASKSLSQLSIVLMVPNSVSDTPNGRDQEWIESIVPAIQKAARDFQCCFINTYQFLQDSVNASDFMDNPYGDGRHIHPNDVMNLWISGILFNTMFPKGLIGNLAKNNIVNDWNGNTIKSITDLPDTYPYGVSIYRTTNAPINGILISFRAADEVIFQINHGYDMASNGYSIRLGHSVSNTWSSWNTLASSLETVTAPTLLNSWVNYDAVNGRTAGYYKDSFGIVHLQGLIKNGITTPPTTLFTLPVGYRPTKACYFPVSSNNAFGCISVDTTGIVAIQAGSNVWLSLDGVTFRL